MLSKARVAYYSSLKRRSVRRSEGVFLIEGARLVGEALRSGAGIEQILITAGAAEAALGRGIVEGAGNAGIALTTVTERECRRIADTRTPQGVLGVVRRAEPEPEILDGPGLYLALDGVADPGNVGTLIRSADAFGIRAVVAGPETADFENGKTLRAAMGSGFHVNTVRTEDLPATLRRMKGAGATVLAGVLDGEDPHLPSGAGGFAVLVLGNEAHGVSGAAAELADRRLTVPCPGRAESLNVAMAGAILLFALSRGRGGSDAG